MIVESDPRHRGAAFALTAGRKQNHLPAPERGIRFAREKRIDAFEEATFARDIDDTLHRAAEQHDLAAGSLGRQRHGANARDIGGESRDHDAPARTADHVT